MQEKAELESEAAELEALHDIDSLAVEKLREFVSAHVDKMDAVESDEALALLSQTTEAALETASLLTNAGTGTGTGTGVVSDGREGRYSKRRERRSRRRRRGSGGTADSDVAAGVDADVDAYPVAVSPEEERLVMQETSVDRLREQLLSVMREKVDLESEVVHLGREA
jgi:hypothetical protein